MGRAQTPTFERLAGQGLKFNRFHTTALCSPTRQALLTGRNHHAVGMGGITEIATSAPGYNSIRPDTAAPLAETLKLNGYSTAQFGKCHEVPVWETSPMGPFHQWPPGSGFEYFYGFVGAETNQWYPALYDGVTPVEPPKTPEEGYHFTEDMTDKAITWVRQQKSLMPDKPFFMYFAPGATHAPHHVPKEWSDKYKGRFDAGWDAIREETFARQKELGVIPADAELTARPDEIPAWDDMPEDLKPVLARQMEVYAGFMEHTDHHIGRLVDSLDDLGILDDTLVYVIVGDNGASAEGTPNGTFNEIISLNGAAAAGDRRVHGRAHRRLRHAGGLQPLRGRLGARDGHAVPVDQAGRVPLRRHPQRHHRALAERLQGPRRGPQPVPPRHRRRRDRARRRRAAGADVRQRHPADAAARREHGLRVRRRRRAGGARDAVLRDVLQPRHLPQGLDRGHPPQHPVGVRRELPALDDDVWELYDTNTDWTQAHDLAAEQPDKLAELQRLWLIEAVKYNVLPLDDRRIERFNSDLAGRPVLVKGNSQILYGGMGRLSENSVLNLKNKSHSVTAEIVVPDGGGHGVIIAQGGAFAGWSLYLHDGKPKYCHNLAGLQRFYVEADTAVPAGEHQVRMEFAYDGGGLAKGGAVTLFVDGDKVGEGRVEATVPMIYSGDETCDVGSDTGTPVSDDYTSANSRFNGTVNWVQLDAGVDDHDHLITPEERLRVAMAIQ